MDILFLGTHGQYNIGDELLLETFLRQLGAQHRFAVNSYDPQFTEDSMKGKYDLESFHTTKQLPRFLKHLITSDLLFFGGGSIIKELYQSVGRNRYATLLMILASVTFAKQLTRKRVIMSNIGVGPISTPNGERLARWILNQVDFVSVRDDKSLNTCLQLGISPQKVQRVPDAVFANPPDVFVSQPSQRIPSAKLKVALNLNYDIENPNAFESFTRSLAEALILLNQAQSIEVHALPMQSRFKANDDLTILKAFSQQIPDIEFCLHDPQTAQEAAQIINECDIVLAERLHTLVIASILGKPFYGLIYDVKVRELVGYLGMSDYALDINQPFSGQQLLEGIQRLIANQTEVSHHLVACSSDLRAQLESYFGTLRSSFNLDAPSRNP